MSQFVRVRICRAAFVLLCLLPTLGFVGWAGKAAISTDRYGDKTLWEDELSRILGLRIRIERVEQPELGRTLLVGVDVSDPEGGLLARVHAIELARTTEGLAIAAEHPELQADGLARLWATLDGVMRTRGPRDLAIHFTAASLSLHEANHGGDSPPRAITLADVDAWLAESEAGPWLKARFHSAAELAHSPSEVEPMQLDVVRNCRLSDERTTKWRINTAAAALPCWTLAGAVPELARLGAECRFAGQLVCERTTAGWQVDADVAMQRVDLQRLIARPFGHAIAGIADIRLAGLRVRDGRLEAVQGELGAEDVRIGDRLLDAAEVFLPVALNQNVQLSEGDEVRLKQLCFEFRVDGARVQWGGLCDGPGFVLATDAGGRPLLQLVSLAGPDDETRKTTTALWQTLAGDASAPGSVALLEWLAFPPPPVRPSSGDQPRATLRPFGQPGG